MLRSLQVRMYMLTIILLAGAPKLAWPQEVIPAGQTVGLVSERSIVPVQTTRPVRQERAEVQPEVPVAPKFSLSISGSDAEMARQAFLEYARAIGQPVDLLDYSGRFSVNLREETDSSRDAWSGLAAEAGRRLTRGRVSFETDDRRTLTLSGEIREGNKIHYIRSASETGRRVRVEASAWSGWSNRLFAGAGRDTDPQTRLRANAVRELIPQLMEELQSIVVADAAAKEAAARERLVEEAGTPSAHSAPKAGYEYELLTSMDNGSNRLIATSRPLRVGQTIKLMRGSRRVGTISVRYFAGEGRIAVQGDSTLACDPSIKLVPAA